jgi:hypothetical protein
MSQKFERLRFDFGTPGVQNAAITLAWEYWNGSAWTAFTPDSDSTSELTADGSVVWTIANLTGWVANAVNSSTLFWVRVRFTAGSWTANPTVNYVTATGWTLAFTGTNEAAYRQGAGNGFFINVNDNGPGAGGAKEVRVRGYEAMGSVESGGTGLSGSFPTAAQVTNGYTWRKSTTADGTARNWIVWADDRTFMVFLVSGDTANHHWTGYYGDIKSNGGGADGFRTLLSGRTAENTGTLTNDLFPLAGTTGFAMARSYTGAGTSILCGNWLGGTWGTGTPVGTVQYPNGPDGTLRLGRRHIGENTSLAVRGWLRGVYTTEHAISNFALADTCSGKASGNLDGKTFVVVKTVANNNVVLFLETSDTVETD